MADRILYIAFAVSIVGVLLIAYVSPSLKPPRSKIADIGPSSLEKAVRFQGRVVSVHEFKGGSVLLSVQDAGSSVDVFLPRNIAKGSKASSLKGRQVEVTGVVQVYRGKTEIVIEKPGGLVVR